MEMKLHFDILIKAYNDERIDLGRLKALWPGYQNNIHLVPCTTGFRDSVMIKARLLADGHLKASATRSVAHYDQEVSGSVTDAIDFIMEGLLSRINNTQNTAFSRHVSRIGYVGPAIKQHFIFPPELLEKRYRIPELKRVHSSGPVSVAIWSNGKKSMVRRQKGDKSDPEKGILYAVIKGLCYEKGGTKEYSRVLDMIHEVLEERKNG